MNRFILSLFILLALPVFALADTAKFSPEQQKIFEDASRFREIHASSNLPPAVVTLCADGNGRFAEPGRAWNVGDAIIDDTLPASRLIWGATDGDYYVVHFERGGIGHSFQILIVNAKPDSAKPVVILHSYSVHPLKNYKAFIQAMQAGKLISRD
jgi:hypothetical protein